jgi:hypothetical protein
MELIIVRKDTIIFDQTRMTDKFVSFSYNQNTLVLAVVTVNFDTREHKHPKYNTTFFKLSLNDDKNRLVKIGT